MTYGLGIDLGTSFVSAAVSRQSRTEMVTLGDHSVAVPTAVYVTDDGSVLTGDTASRRAASDPDRGSREFMRRLGDPAPVILGGTPYPATDLLGSLLRDVLRKVTAKLGTAPARVALTYPSSWGQVRRNQFAEVPAIAGLTDAAMFIESEALAVYYTSRPFDQGDTVVVYDLGGGTFNATVLRRGPERMDVLGTPEGIERLGGVDFDDALMGFLNFSSGGALVELDTRDPTASVALARLRQDCVLAKEALSADTETVLPVLLPSRHFDIRITRAEFEGLVRARIESTIGAVNGALRSARVTPEELTSALLVGGSSRIPLVTRMVFDALGRTPVSNSQRNALAMGAAALASSTMAANGRATLPPVSGPRSTAGGAPAPRVDQPSPPAGRNDAEATTTISHGSRPASTAAGPPEGPRPRATPPGAPPAGPGAPPRWGSPPGAGPGAPTGSGAPRQSAPPQTGAPPQPAAPPWPETPPRPVAPPWSGPPPRPVAPPRPGEWRPDPQAPSAASPRPGGWHDKDPSADEDWPDNPSWRRLVVAIGVLAVCVVLALILFVVMSRVRAAGLAPIPANHPAPPGPAAAAPAPDTGSRAVLGRQPEAWT